jgi:hypothetical protein
MKNHREQNSGLNRRDLVTSAATVTGRPTVNVLIRFFFLTSANPLLIQLASTF